MYTLIYSSSIYICWPQWPRGLRHEQSSPARKLGSWFRIPLEVWMSVCSSYYVFSIVVVWSIKYCYCFNIFHFVNMYCLDTPLPSRRECKRNEGARDRNRKGQLTPLSLVSLKVVVYWSGLKRGVAVNDFCFLPAKFCNIIIYVQKFESHVKIANRLRLGKFPIVRRTFFSRRCNFSRWLSAANSQTGQWLLCGGPVKSYCLIAHFWVEDIF
jgi:hypothetical protein